MCVCACVGARVWGRALCYDSVELYWRRTPRHLYNIFQNKNLNTTRYANPSKTQPTHKHRLRSVSVFGCAGNVNRIGHFRTQGCLEWGIFFLKLVHNHVSVGGGHIQSSFHRPFTLHNPKMKIIIALLVLSCIASVALSQSNASRSAFSSSILPASPHRSPSCSPLGGCKVQGSLENTQSPQKIAQAVSSTFPPPLSINIRVPMCCPITRNYTLTVLSKSLPSMEKVLTSQALSLLVLFLLTIPLSRTTLPALSYPQIPIPFSLYLTRIAWGHSLSTVSSDPDGEGIVADNVSISEGVSSRLLLFCIIFARTPPPKPQTRTATKCVYF